jgi:hypothetical protein
MTDLLPCQFEPANETWCHEHGRFPHECAEMYSTELSRRPPSPKLELPQEVREAMKRTKSVDEGGCPCEDCDDNRTFAAFIRRIAGEGDRG